MKRFYLVILSIFAIFCFMSANCSEGKKGSGEFGDLNFQFGGSYYLSPDAPQSPRPFRDITAAELVSEIKIGWNLGNTFDAVNLTWLGDNPYVSSMEVAWVRHYTEDYNIESIKNAGFNGIRIPVSWVKATDEDLNIREDWMDRITEVVNWAVDNDMYIIINTHHDEEVFKFTASQRESSLTAFHKIWSQIAYNFRNYNEKLIFEALNEPRTPGSSAEWRGGTKPEHEILNEYYRLFVKIVRESGGNNAKRVIMVNTYAASAEQIAIDALEIPEDTVPNKIIASIHAYAPYNFALNQGGGATKNWSRDSATDTRDVRAPFDRAYEKWVANGIPVIMGEFGAVDRENEDARVQWAEYYVGYGREKGIPCFLWDNNAFKSSGENFGHYDRGNDTFPFPGYHEALMRGAGVR